MEFVIFTVLPKIKKLERSISLAIDDVEQLPIVKFRLDRIDCVYTKTQVCLVSYCTLSHCGFDKKELLYFSS